MATLRENYDGFIEDLEEKNRAESTVLAYGTDIRQLIEFLDDPEADEIKYGDLASFLDDLEDSGYTKKSISRKINSIRTFFRHLKEEGEISENPASRLKHPQFEIKPPRILLEMEYRALRDVVRDDKRMYAVVELLLQTGIRIGELREVRIEDITFSDNGPGELYVRPSHRRPGRAVPLNKAAQEAIKDYLEVRPESDSDILFITKTGNPFLIRNIRASLNRYFEKAGIEDATVSSLRHTFVAHHLSRGADVTYISNLIGHKRLTSTEKYLQYVDRPEKETKELEEL